MEGAGKVVIIMLVCVLVFFLIAFLMDTFLGTEVNVPRIGKKSPMEED